MHSVREHEKQERDRDGQLPMLPAGYKGILSGHGSFAGATSHHLAIQRLLAEQQSLLAEPSKISHHKLPPDVQIDVLLAPIEEPAKTHRNPPVQ